MKKRIRKILEKMGVDKPLVRLYNDLRVFTFSLFWREIRLRLPGKKGNLPFPPSQLIFLVVANDWRANFLECGKRLMADMKALLGKNGIAMESFATLLDFGCGCGRLIRHLQELPAGLHGCDYNERLIRWCQGHLPFARFTVNGLHPPLPYPDRHFDFIYARSVLTHLDEPLQTQWMNEFHRVLQSGGILYVSTHGDRFLSNLTPEEEQRYRQGELVVRRAEVSGENQCSAYEAPSFVNRLLKGFSLVEYVPGRDDPQLWQDIYLLKKD